MEKGKDKLNAPVEAIKGIGPKIAGIFKKRGIETVEDLLYFLPFRYEDRRDVCSINELKEGEKASVLGTVTAYKSLFFRHSRKKAFEVIIEDGTGTLSIKWFQWNKYYLKNICRKGNLLLLSGEVKRFGTQLQMIHPDVTMIEHEDEVKNYKTVMPVYSEVEGIKQGVLRNIIKEAFEMYEGYIQSVIPESIENSHGLIPLYEAFRGLHFPDEKENCSTFNVQGSRFRDQKTEVCGSTLSAPRSTLIDRLIFEEYFLFQSALLMKKREIKQGKGIRFKTDGHFYRRFKDGLPFELTGAQDRVVGEIEHDMGLNEPMNRLLQGDVGCGKTVCAILASCIAIDNSYQVAFMAPTEILAEQHYLSVHRFFDGLGVSVAFLRGNMGKERKGIIEHIRDGKTSVIVGTHALIQKDVMFRRLGLVIIDEQHRFGVVQRKTLKGRVQGVEGSRGQVEEESETAYRNDISSEFGGKSVSAKEIPDGFKLKTLNLKLKTVFTPDTLVMTATPIPRTLSMVVYGDLDVSVIDELPKGRQKILTKVFLEQHKPAVYRMMEEELKNGKQIFIVYPLVEESDKSELLNAKDMAVHFRKTVFPSRKIGLLHGRMRPEEKEKVMGRFKNNEIDILVCTTVIEVGIDVPNATMIVIEHAERFGLSQLHQLRGRVGRGIHASRCILITSAKRTDVAAKRLKVMESTSDGFKIAEEDMKMRGPGEMLGSKQAGVPDFRVGDVMRDINIMIYAREIADEAMGKMTVHELNRIKEKAGERWKNRIHLVDVA
ncbi:MAG: ATP-dependent DNA helicase RecG [Deltaproteobacteria bacterium]